MEQRKAKKIWEENAQFWDNAMGDESNNVSWEVVRPSNEPLSPNPVITFRYWCVANGNYSSFGNKEAPVVAFDCSKKMIEFKDGNRQYAKQIEFVWRMTDRKKYLNSEWALRKQLLIWQYGYYDWTTYGCLWTVVGKRNFCLCNAHPLFCHVDWKYMTPHSYDMIEGQPKEQIY